MASWAALPALSGFGFDMRGEKEIHFAHKISEDDFRTFFSTGGAWGTYRQFRENGTSRAKVRILGGGLKNNSVTARDVDDENIEIIMENQD